MQHVSATDGKTVYGGNHGFRDAADLLLHVQYAQAGNAVLTDIPAASFHILVASGAESLVARSGNDNHINIRFLTADAQGIAHFSGSGRGKRIAVAFAVDGDTGNSVIVFKKNIFIFPDGCPFSFCLHNLYSILIDDNNSSTYGCLRPCR